MEQSRHSATKLCIRYAYFECIRVTRFVFTCATLIACRLSPAIIAIIQTGDNRERLIRPLTEFVNFIFLLFPSTTRRLSAASLLSDFPWERTECRWSSKREKKCDAASRVVKKSRDRERGAAWRQSYEVPDRAKPGAIATRKCETAVQKDGRQCFLHE